MKKRVKMMIMIMKVAFFLLFMGKDIATKKEENLEKTERKKSSAFMIHCDGHTRFINK